MFTYQYERPAYTADCIVFYLNFFSRSLETVLITRKKDPFKDCLALPGGFVDLNESVEESAKRELKEETNLELNEIIQLYTFSDPGRDPRGWTVTTAYFGFTSDISSLKAGDDAMDVKVLPVFDVLAGKHGKLAFDHDKIFKMAVERAQIKVKFSPFVFSLLPKQFTMSQFESVCQIVLNKPMDPANFRKKILMMNILEEVGVQTEVQHRPAKIYKFNKDKYEIAAANGFNFQI